VSDEADKQGSTPPPETKGHEAPKVEPTREYGHEPPAVTPRGEGGDVAAGHQAPETRGHQPPADLELGHPPAEGVVIVQSVGEMHSPAQEAPRPTAAPPKPADAAQSVTPPQAHRQAAGGGDAGSGGGEAQND